MRYFTVFLVGLGLVVLVFVILIKMLTGGKPKQQIDLNSYATTDAVVRMTIDGPVNADSLHRQIQISIDNSQAEIQIMNGYQGDVKLDKTFDNNQPAFEAFLHAINLAGYTKGNPDPKLSDERGYCPQGSRYVFELLQGGDTIQRYWSTACGGQGTYGGKTTLTRELFQAQIPDFDKFTGNIQL